MTLNQMTLGARVRTSCPVRVWPGIEVPANVTGTITAIDDDDSPGGARQILLDQRVTALDQFGNVLVVFHPDTYADGPVTAEVFEPLPAA